MNGLSVTIDSSAAEHSSLDVPLISYAYEISSSSGPPDTSSRTRTVDAAQERLWTDLSSLYIANEELKTTSTLKPTSRNNDGPTADDVAEKLESLLESFMNGANAVLEELSFLGNAHPALAVAIFAFREVVKLDIARRDNNKKVLVVIIQMQSMMGPMFQLRNLNRDHMPAAERDYHEGRLQELIEVIARNIKECRSDISHFMNRKFMLKLVLAKGYEKKFATHMEVFALRRSELLSVISEYLAIGISSATVALADVGRKLNVVDDKLETIISRLFRNLDTPREREVFRFIQQNGGPRKCVDDLDLLPKLISKVGEPLGTAGSPAIYDQKGLQDLQKQLREALIEDLDKVLEKHYSRFEKILQVQNNNLKSMSAHLKDQGVLMQTHTTRLGKILDTVTTIMVMEEGRIQTKAVKLKDPEIHRVWMQMNLTRSSVKAKVFVLTLRDHISNDNSNPGTPILKRAVLPEEVGDSKRLHPSAPNITDKESDEWVLDYIDVAYVQPIVEAIDEDASGFISVKEANSFALARPQELSLLHWIAYWAAGWHINLANQKREIYSVLLEMYDALPSIHVANRKLVDDYLDDHSLWRVEALLRSIKPLSDTGRKERKLLEIANTVASSQFERLKKNLEDMGYSIESGTDATTIGGSARVETWILPLLLLLLRRHLDIIHLAKTVVLDSSEFEAHVTSLASVFVVFYERMESLEAKFRQLHRDIDNQFENFSYGMFLAAFKKTDLKSSENTLLSLKMDENNGPKSAMTLSNKSVDTSILSRPAGSLVQYEILESLPSEGMPSDHIPHPMEGPWSGLMIHADSGWRDSFACVIHPFTGKAFAGKGEAYFGTLDITNGKFNPEETSSHELVGITFDIPTLSMRCQGMYDPQRDFIKGTFSWMAKEIAPVQTENVQTESQETTEHEVGGDQNRQDLKPLADDDDESKPDLNEDAGIGGDTAILESGEVNILNQEPNSDGVPYNPASTLIGEPSVPSGSFYLTRTPPDVSRFRSLLDGPGRVPCWTIWPTARKRWAFAIEAILFQTRLRLGSRKVLDFILSERRRWLVYCQRFDLTDSSSSSRWFRYEPLSDSEWEDYAIMLSTVNPIIARLYEAMGHYLMSRGTWSIGFVYCDACGKSLAFTRYQCIICMEDDLSHQIDLCENCFNKPDTVHGAGNLTHIPSHSLLRSRHRVHTFEVKTLVGESRLISERSKSIFRVQEAKKLEMKEHDSRKATRGKGTKNKDPSSAPSKNDEPAPTCACCAVVVSTPCWVCVTCSPLTFICDSCGRKNAPVVQAGQGHLLKHHLLRIYDSVEVKAIRTNDTERQLEELNLNISALEKKVDIQLEEAKKMKSVVNDVAKTVGVRDDDHSTIASSDSDDEFPPEDNTELHVKADMEIGVDSEGETNDAVSSSESDNRDSEETDKETSSRPKNQEGKTKPDLVPGFLRLRQNLRASIKTIKLLMTGILHLE
ncbi:hypothetical protein GALMADRAFT_225374 [Galerina marginata CBS 339.88]|uniref:ZZ-type domain-containing protein n=1 Tax=Galerina marginata (strain CBS 339.88) TaxID=685588 RepID=A0A067T243_GALM3|nr:hypothetical protein GALMADRAFT_225374 [Galerina marginata CBS 339.88]